MSLLVGVLVFLLQVFLVIVFIRVILSWLNPYPTNSVTRIFWQITEPVLAPIRRCLPPMSGFDLSPLVVWLAALVLIALLRNIAP